MSAPVDAVVMASAAPKERPILFSAPMVRAILEGCKTQTRRVVKFSQFGRSDTPGYQWHFRGTRRGGKGHLWQDLRHAELLDLCPYGRPGDRLWVREAWGDYFDGSSCPKLRTGEGWQNRLRYRICCDRPWEGKWRPSIHMPRWASRITLEITSVRVEQLGDITESDAIAEGAIDQESLDEGYSAVGFFNSLWARINGEFDRRTWVWVVEFNRLG